LPDVPQASSADLDPTTYLTQIHHRETPMPIMQGSCGGMGFLSKHAAAQAVYREFGFRPAVADNK
jgi:hypothetical protein